VRAESHESDFPISKLIFQSRFFQVLWLCLFALVLVLYYRGQIPLRFIARNLLPLAVALTHVLALSGLGWPLVRVAIKTNEKWIKFLTSLAFGIGLTGILVFSLGLMGNFDPLLFASWEIAGIILFLIALKTWWPLSIPRVRWNFWNVPGAAILLLFFVAELPFVLAPEISTDAIAYHLLIPKMYLAHGGIYHLTLFVEAYYPSLAEYNYLPLLLLSNEIVCKVFHFWTGILSLILLGQMIKRVSPESSRWLAPALFLSMPVTAIHIAWAWNDFLYTLFLLLAIYFLICYHQSDKASARDLLVSGILAGLASWMKYTFVLFFLTVLLLLLLGSRRWNWKIRHYPLFFAGIGLIAPFWMLQNWIFTENPFYPFLNKIFHSPFWTEIADHYFHNALRHWEISHWNWLTYLTFPIHITMLPRLIDIHPGILPLVLAPLLFFRTKSAGVRLLKAYVGCCMLVWLFIHTENRSLFSVFAVLFCVAAIALEELRFASKRVRFFMAVGIVLAACTNFFYASLTMYQLFDPFPYFLGRETASEYRTRLSESQQLFDYLNRATDAKRVLLVSSHVPYYLNRPALFSSFADPPIAEVLSYETRSAADEAEKMRALGITYVLINRSAYEKENKAGLYSWSREQRLLFEEFLLKHCEPVLRQDSDYLFRVKPQ